MKLRRGTTLIEVLAGLVILGTLLASLAIARGRFIRQCADADQRIQAVEEINHLLEAWLAGSPQTVPIESQGTTDDPGHPVWRTKIIPSAGARSLGTNVVRLQIFAHQADENPLASVDFLIADTRGSKK